MLDKIKKLGLYGIGLAVLTEEKIEAMVKEAVEEGKLSKTDAKAAVKDLISESKKEREKFSKSLKKEVAKVLGELGVPTKKDVASLQARINSLEKEIMKELKEKR